MTEVQTPIEYATPADPTRPSRITAAAMIFIGGIALIPVGGCFLIGILLILKNGFVAGPPNVLSPADWMLVAILGGLGLACFAGAVTVIIIGLKALLRITRS